MELARAEFLYKFNQYTQGLEKICKRLRYTDKQIIKFKRYFFVDIRNALSHADHRYELDKDIKFKYVICDTDDGIIKLDSSKMMLIMEKMIKLTSIHGELLTYYRQYI